MNTYPLTIENAQEIAAAILRRQRMWGESLDVAVPVVLFNIGDHFTGVSCINGEWSGTKAQLTPRDGVPLCPNGHVMLETDRGRKLAWVDGG
jgi:hypothetical protein